MQIMTAATLSFRVSSELANHTRELAQVLNMPISEYVREAVRDKNVQVLKDRMVFCLNNCLPNTFLKATAWMHRLVMSANCEA